jgi:hypothetical protein
MLDPTIDGDPVRESGAAAPPPVQTLAAPPKLSSDTLPDEEGTVRLRRQTPMGEPLPITFRWIAKLPQRVRPFALLRQYPRIANMMAGMWPDQEAYHAYLHDLLTDRRGNRRGFPPEIVQELFALRVHYEQLHPGMLAAYKEANKRG